MNQFVEECRQEWKRLGVPDFVADEMAADLEADLGEAEAEGVSSVELLGSAASDPRSFAAAWAAERGVIPPPRLTTRVRRRTLVQVAIAALAVVAAVGAGLVIFASPKAEASAPTRIVAFPSPPPRPATVTFLRDVPDAVWIKLDRESSSGVDIDRTGSILLIVGIVGVILATPLLFWSSPRRFRTAQP